MAGLDGTDTSTTVYIDDLNPLNPDKNDPKSQGDDHIRFTKRALVNSFPGVTGPVTSTNTELNILDGATLTTTELNYVDGVTSAIQTQLNAKAPTASPTFTGTVVLPSTTSIGDVSNTELAVLNGITSTTEELNVLDGITATTEELNILDGVTVTAAQLNAPVLMTAQASTSGTAIEFTSIPAWAKRITVMFSGVSTNGTSNLIFQIGDSGGYETSGYNSASGAILGTSAGAGGQNAGFLIRSAAAAAVLHGALTLTLVDAATYTWAATGIFSRSNDDAAIYVAGAKALSAALDRVRVTTVNGTDAFDAGTINVMYE